MRAERRILLNSTMFDANIVKFLLQEKEFCEIGFTFHDFPYYDKIPSGIKQESLNFAIYDQIPSESKKKSNDVWMYLFPLSCIFTEV